MHSCSIALVLAGNCLDFVAPLEGRHRSFVCLFVCFGFWIGYWVLTGQRVGWAMSYQKVTPALTWVLKALAGLRGDVR